MKDNNLARMGLGCGAVIGAQVVEIQPAGDGASLPVGQVPGLLALPGGAFPIPMTHFLPQEGEKGKVDVGGTGQIDDKIHRLAVPGKIGDGEGRLQQARSRAQCNTRRGRVGEGRFARGGNKFGGLGHRP